MASQLFQTRLKALAVGLAVAVLAVGCQSQDPVPKMPDPTLEPTTAEPTATPTEDPLAIPAAAKKPNKAGAEAAIRHFWDMVNHVSKTGDSAPAREVFEDSCAYCEGGVGVMQATYEQGHTVAGGAQSVEWIHATLLKGNDDAPAAFANVKVRSNASTERDADGQVVNRLPAGSSVLGYVLEFRHGHWSITSVGEKE